VPGTKRLKLSYGEPPSNVAFSFNLGRYTLAHGRHDLLEEWAHPDKAPQEFTPASSKRVPWVCALGDHKWTVGAVALVPSPAQLLPGRDIVERGVRVYQEAPYSRPGPRV